MADLNSFQTLGDAITEAYNELAEDSNSSVPGLEQEQMEKWANRFSKWFLEKVHIKSQEESYTFLMLADTTLSAAASSGASSISITDATNYPVGASLVIIESTPYLTTSRSSTTITLSETLERAFESGGEVQPAYSLPSDFGKPRNLSVEGVQYTYVKWGVKQDLGPQEFTYYKGFLYFPKARSADDVVTLHYYAKPTNTLADTDNMEIYQMWDAYVIYRLVARGHRLLYDDQRAGEYEALAREVLMKAKTMVATEDGSLMGNAFQPGW